MFDLDINIGYEGLGGYSLDICDSLERIDPGRSLGPNFIVIILLLSAGNLHARLAWDY